MRNPCASYCFRKERKYFEKISFLAWIWRTFSTIVQETSRCTARRFDWILVFCKRFHLHETSTFSCKTRSRFNFEILCLGFLLVLPFTSCTLLVLRVSQTNPSRLTDWNIAWSLSLHSPVQVSEYQDNYIRAHVAGWGFRSRSLPLH